MSEELKSNENVGAPQPDALAQIASVDPSPTVGGMHPFTPAMLSRLKKQRQPAERAGARPEKSRVLLLSAAQVQQHDPRHRGHGSTGALEPPHPGLCSPAEFMPLLERTGLVTRLDQYIWESVCQTLQKWQESGSNLVPVSVNVSVQDILNLDVPQIFADLVEKYSWSQTPAGRDHRDHGGRGHQMVENAIQGLHRKGFSVMMDDFGSGYSSLNMLKDTNADAIKLDMKLIDMKPAKPQQGRADRGIGGGYGPTA